MSSSRKVHVGIIAPSSKVPEAEFELGLDRIREAGFEPHVHPQVLQGHLFFAGTDEARAQAFYDYALDSRFRVLWAARGGYGSVRLLPLLEMMTAQRGIPPKKLLVGFSDSTALLEFVRARWGWATLHAPMPGLRKFCLLPDHEWKPLGQLIRGEKAKGPLPPRQRLEFIGGRAPKADIQGPLIGGNLAVWSSLVGTPFAGNPRGKILFFEDVDENLYRVDRMVQQLLLAGAFQGARAVVLGNFSGCRDIVPQVLAKRPPRASRDLVISQPRPEELEPLRPSMDPDRALAEIFGEVILRHGIPVAWGLPVGHGPGKAPLPLGGRYVLTPKGELKLERWEWLKKRK
jgi:muramoyltetrapeptide carboxypeptidase